MMISRDDYQAMMDDEKIPTPTTAEDYLSKAPAKERGRGVAEQALAVINGERQDQYGNPENTFPVIADLWHAYLKALKPDMPRLTPDDVANMMILLKMARIVCGAYKRDNDVDLIGYAMLGADMRAEAAK